MSFTISGTGGLTFPDATTMTTGSQAVKAWVNFNGSTAAIRASYNVGSITKNATGDYTLNFTSALADVNYSTVGSASTSASDFRTLAPQFASGWVYSTTQARVGTVYQTGLADCVNVYVAVFR